MTSKRPAGNPDQECFVYITLPGETEAITAGRFVLEQGRGRFVYRKAYRENPRAVPIDPVELKLSPVTYETARLGGVFGALRDAGPDFWGRRIIDKHAGRPMLSEIDYLLESPDDRAGALAFGLGVEPPAPRRHFNRTFDLETLQTLANNLIDDEVSSDSAALQAQDLLLLGTSMGGARPKAVVADDQGLWIAKFNRTDDRWNNARVEHAMLRLARQCGLHTAESRLETIAGKDVLLIKRFDRQKVSAGYTRSRMISALTVLRAEESSMHRERWSYLLLVEEMRKMLPRPEHDAHELFARMCFNAMISNLDDHPRNHAFLAPDTTWMLSPAYDLTPSRDRSPSHRDLAMDCGSQGRFANAANLLSQCERFLLARPQAEDILRNLREEVANWYPIVRACGVTEGDAERIAGAMLYPGFDRVD